MSIISIPIYRTEAGVHTNPAVNGLVSTNCEDGLYTVNKTFFEVLIHWTGAAWVEDPVYVPAQSIPALKIVNQCDSTFAYVNYPLSNFRLAGQCCVDETPVEP